MAKSKLASRRAQAGDMISSQDPELRLLLQQNDYERLSELTSLTRRQIESVLRDSIWYKAMKTRSHEKHLMNSWMKSIMNMKKDGLIRKDGTTSGKVL